MSGSCTSGPWWVALVLVVAAAKVTAQGSNVALFQPVNQTSTRLERGYGAASHGVDGNTATDFWALSCTHTKDVPGSDNPAWWVDLGQSFFVGRVVIYNRQDCCWERINPFNIQIGDSEQVTENPKCGSDHEFVENQPSITVSCPGMRGRYVGVRLPGPMRILTLCEVQVYPDVNVALGKPAFETSVEFGGVAGRAVDGNTNTNWYNNSCTHTQDQSNPSWWVDLGKSVAINGVVIFNRQDCCAGRLNPFEIQIGDSSEVGTNPKCVGEYRIALNQSSITIVCPGMKGRYVGVLLPGVHLTLTLCEVQVWTNLDVGICGAWGDPHYYPFDGGEHHFQGPCRYTFAADCGSSRDFNVTTQNVPIPWNPSYSSVREVYVEAHGFVVGVLQGRAVTVNGRPYSLPISLRTGGLIEVSLTGLFVRVLLANLGVEIFFDGIDRVKVEVPDNYRGQMCGLCGNFNGNTSDDYRTPDGTVVGDWTTFGDSWLTDSDTCMDSAANGRKKRQSGPELTLPSGCSDDLQAAAESADSCGLLKDSNGPFAVCHGTVDPDTYFNTCVFDICALNGNTIALCSNLAAYVDACRAAGVPPFSWRTEERCSEVCPLNSTFSTCASYCPATCRNPNADEQCYLGCGEGCECDPGFLLSGKMCVPEEQCGCDDGVGRYYIIGERWSEDGRSCVCEAGNTTTCVECDEAEGYRLMRRDGVWGCHCVEDRCNEKFRWLEVFATRKNTGQTVYDAWKAASNEKVLHKRCPVVDIWESLDIKRVRVVLESSSGDLLKELIFNGRNTDRFSWFTKSNLLKSPWIDVYTEQQNFFSIEGFQIDKRNHQSKVDFILLHSEHYGIADRMVIYIDTPKDVKCGSVGIPSGAAVGPSVGFAMAMVFLNLVFVLMNNMGGLVSTSKKRDDDDVGLDDYDYQASGRTDKTGNADTKA
ncbi:ZAN [Branchiostoma lanceolatum]|uniref:ZAN protein n=1 Tax=Branchiostoma lanceolatum TaxID=7740 RepID=A0A8J9ZD67_BRALA|nr:ZAN [Branchiostoma lanceolatum]